MRAGCVPVKRDRGGAAFGLRPNAIRYRSRRFCQPPVHFRFNFKFSDFSIISTKRVRAVTKTRVISAIVKNAPKVIREKLIRVRTQRRDKTVELRIHYAASSQKGCTIFTILGVDELL